MERAWKKAVIWQFKVLYQYVLGWSVTSTSAFFFNSMIFAESRVTAKEFQFILCAAVWFCYR
jgi:hypothetical protein